MIEAYIDPKDLKEFHKDMRDLHPKRLLSRELDPLGRSVIRKGGVYPPSSGYPRTGHLGRSWWYDVMGTDLEVGNAAIYAGWVHGEEQLSYHALRGWKRVYGIMVDETSKLLKRLERKVDKLWR